MSVPFNPATWASFNLSLRNKSFDTTMQLFLAQLSQFAVQTQAQIVQLQDSVYTAGLLNGKGLLLGSAFTKVIVDLGTITTDQTVPVAGAQFVYVRLESAVTQTRLLTLSGLPQGAIVLVQINDTANALTIKMAGTDQNANVYGISAWNTATATVSNMVSTGILLTTGTAYVFWGMSGYVTTTTSPQLDLLFV